MKKITLFLASFLLFVTSTGYTNIDLIILPNTFRASSPITPTGMKSMLYPLQRGFGLYSLLTLEEQYLHELDKQPRSFHSRGVFGPNYDPAPSPLTKFKQRHQTKEDDIVVESYENFLIASIQSDPDDDDEYFEATVTNDSDDGMEMSVFCEVHRDKNGKPVLTYEFSGHFSSEE